MIRLIFTIQRELMIIEIENREIFYKDRKMLMKTRMIPVDSRLAVKIAMSRNRLPAYLLEMFNLTKEEQTEYDNAKDEEELARICIKDCEKNGAILQKKEVI